MSQPEKKNIANSKGQQPEQRFIHVLHKHMCRLLDISTELSTRVIEEKLKFALRVQQGSQLTRRQVITQAVDCIIEDESQTSINSYKDVAVCAIEEMLISDRCDHNSSTTKPATNKKHLQAYVNKVKQTIFQFDKVMEESKEETVRSGDNDNKFAAEGPKLEEILEYNDEMHSPVAAQNQNEQIGQQRDKDDSPEFCQFERRVVGADEGRVYQQESL